VTLANATKAANAGLSFAVYRDRPVPLARTGARSGELYERMRKLEADAVKLDPLIRAQAQRGRAAPSLLSAWNAWYAHWQSLYDAFVSQGGPLVTELPQEERNFDAFVATYNATPGVAPVAFAPRVVTTPEVPAVGLPWYFWVAGGVAIVGVGYLIYRKATGSGGGTSRSRSVSRDMDWASGLDYDADYDLPEADYDRTFESNTKLAPVRSETSLSTYDSARAPYYHGVRAR
jgi:hypothetical protein